MIWFCESSRDARKNRLYVGFEAIVGFLTVIGFIRFFTVGGLLGEGIRMDKG